MKKIRGSLLKKTMLSSSIAAALCVGVVTESQADIYEFTFANGGCVNGSATDTCTGVGDGLFTILSSVGAPTQNSSPPYFLDSDWAFGKRTQIGGSLVISAGTGTGTGTGTMTIDPFEFFDSGNAVASAITFTDIDNANDPGNTLWLGNMLFDWNGNNGIPVSLVWDMTGLLAGLSDTIGTVVTGGSIPASDSMKGNLPMGAAPVAMTHFDTTPLCTTTSGYDGTCLLTNPSGTLPLSDGDAQTFGGDPTDFIGGSPMIDGPFGGFNANFDLTKLTLAGYNDTTPPVVSFSSASITIDVNGTFNPNTPGVTVTCTDTADGTATLSAPGNFTFTPSASDVSAIDNSTPGVYPVGYTCEDNAGARAALSDDPNNIGSPTVPANNTSVSVDLNVIVADPNAPTITILSDAQPTLHEACTSYVDAGSSVYDIQDTGLVASVSDGGFIGSTPSSGDPDASIVYTVDDLGSNPVTAANPSGGILSAVPRTRTVSIVDTTAPVVAIAGGNTAAIESTDCVAYAASLPTATVTDSNSCSPGVSPISTSSTVNCVVPSGQDAVVSNLIYTGSDTAAVPNETTETLVVTVSRSEPVITLNGGGRIFDVGDTYDELGMDIHDVQDGDVSDALVSGTASGITYTITDDIDMSVAGTYTVTYNAIDSDSNAATPVTRSVKVGSYASGSNFTMLNPAGTTFGGTNDVVFDWDESENTDVASTNFNMTIASALPQPFFGNLWTAHHVRVFGPGTWSFDTTCTVVQLEAGVSACNNPLVGDQVERFITMTVPAGQVGVHILFDWNGTENIDVVNVWERDAVWIDPDGDTTTKNNVYDGVSGDAPDVTLPWKLVSTDFDADGINGSPMVDGPFIGFFANFNVGPSGTATRLPYTEEVDVDADFKSKPSAGSMTWLAIALSPIALLVAMRRKLK